MKHVFRKPENLASVGDLIDAKKDQEAFMETIIKQFTSGKKKELYPGQNLAIERANLDNSFGVSPYG